MKWYVLYTRPRSEKKAEKQLLSMGINAYCPTYSQIKIWSDRKKKVNTPLLPSMLLVKLDRKEINKVFECSTVVRYMFWLGKRAIVRQSEVDALRKCLKVSYNISNMKFSKLKIGDNLSLPSFNYESGIVNKISSNTIWIYLNSIGYSVKLKLA